MVPLVVPGEAVNQSSTVVPLTNRRLGSCDAWKVYVPVVGASIQPVVTAANERLLNATEVCATAQMSAEEAQSSVQAWVQQASCVPSPQTLAAQALQLADS